MGVMNEKELFEQLVKAMLVYKKPIDLKQFLTAILTPKELVEISTRLEIVKLLKKGVPQREIAKKLGVGVATVTRGSRELNKGNFKDID